MEDATNEFNDIKIICPEDCGNAPKKQLLKEFNIACVNNDIVFIMDSISDDFQWNIIGKELIQGKENFIETLKELLNSKVAELHICKIITHGYDGSVNGTLTLENNRIYSFCHVYKFTSSRNNSKIKECTSYIIKLP